LTNNKTKFVVVAPQYTARSGGVMILHELCHSLNKNGYPCGVVFLHGGNATDQNFQFGISDDASLYMPNSEYINYSTKNELDEIIRNGVVIYPDLISGNPLGAVNIIRYVLNFNENQFAGDYILSFSKVYSKFAQQILFKPFKNPAFNDIQSAPWHKRTLNLTYFGKGPSFIECKTIKDTILLERDWPRDKKQLALLLKQTKFLFTYDCVSATLQDAFMCGAVPVLLHDNQIPRHLINQMEIGSFPDILFDSIENLPDGMKYDIPSVDLCLKDLQKTYNLLNENWDGRVNDFVKLYLSQLR